MSFTATLFPIIAALSAPEGTYFKTNNSWMCVNDKQTHFIENFFSKKSELSQFNEQELRSWVSKDHNELNNIATKNGFNITFEQFAPDEFGALSILDVMVKWKEEGIVSTVSHKDIVYKAVELKNNFSVIQSAGQNPIARIQTQSNDVVYLTVADEPLAEFALLQKIQELQEWVRKTQTDTSYSALVFPHVALDQRVNISWLKNMQCPNKQIGAPGWAIAQAMQQTKFKMDEKGAHVESAVAISFKALGLLYIEPKKLIIDQPFYVWIERSGCSVPVFAGYIDIADWVTFD